MSVSLMLAAIAMPAGAPARSVKIRVMSGGAPKEVFALLTPQFEKQTGHKVHFTYAVITELRKKLAAGEKTDVIVMPAPAIDGYMKEGKTRPESRATFGIVRLSMVVKQGAALPDISTPEKFRQVLLNARSVVLATPGATPSGTHMAKVIEQLGIADATAKKVIHRPALDGGVQTVAGGEADLGIYPTSEVVNINGVTVAGPLPQELQLDTLYGAAVVADSAVVVPAAAFVKYLADPANRKVWKAGGFDPTAD